jgi:hypothetical protein
MLSNIFISYRREENKYQARMIFDAFQNSKVNVFYDADSIPLGRDFRETIMAQVQKCDVLLALVGRNWAQCLDPKTKLPRLENADDFVRIEIGTALNRGIPVVPVLLDDAPLPETAQLPNDLRNLFDRQAEFIAFRTFDDDVKRLITKLAIKGRQEQEPSELTSTVYQAGDAPPLRNHAAGYNFMGRAVPLPSFEILTRASGWVQRQATIWLSIVKNPKEFIAGTDIDSPKALGDSIQFLVFTCVCITLLSVALDIFIGARFSLMANVLYIVLLLVGVLFFTLVVHFSAKAMDGKGSVSRTTTSMFYAAAFFPMILIFDYLKVIDPVASYIGIPVAIYVVTQVVSVAKFIFSFGTIRALIAVGAGGIAWFLYQDNVLRPMLLAMIRIMNHQ